jgi:predicted RNA-binding protein (TIGR00451 family)
MSHARRIPVDDNIREAIRIMIEKQFGEKIANEIAKSTSLEIELSPKTGRIRHVFLDNKRILTLRASDGWFTISLDFAEIILSSCEGKKHKVISEKGIDLKGSLLVPGVVDCDEGIRPGDEVVIVDEDDRLLGVGKAKLSCPAMKSSLKGEAVRVRVKAG